MLHLCQYVDISIHDHVATDNVAMDKPPTPSLRLLFIISQQCFVSHGLYPSSVHGPVPGLSSHVAWAIPSQYRQTGGCWRRGSCAAGYSRGLPWSERFCLSSGQLSLDYYHCGAVHSWQDSTAQAPPQGKNYQGSRSFSSWWKAVANFILLHTTLHQLLSYIL